MNTNRGITFAWLGHPSTVAALLLLIVNDHLLKAAFPGWVTGKLSDLAGLVLAPPLLAALAVLVVPRLPARPAGHAAILTVAAAFATTKAWAYGAELATAAWSLITPSLVRADPTDLLALPALAVCAWSLRRAGRAPARVGTRRFRALRVGVLLPLALAGVAATSATRPARAVQVVTDGDAVYVSTVEWSDSAVWAVSHDDGRTWRPVPLVVASAHRQDSCAGDTCYRVVPGQLAVESRTGAGPWVTAWAIGRDDRRTLYRAYGDMDTLGDDLSSTTLAVKPAAGGGHVVVVANGRDGFAVRDPDGTWRRIGFPVPPVPENATAYADTPYLLPADRVLPDDRSLALILAALSLVLAVTVGAALVLRRAGDAQAWNPAAPLLALAMPGVPFAWAGVAAPGSVFGLAIPLLLVGVAGLAAVCVPVALLKVRRRLDGWRAWYRATATITGLLGLAHLAGYLIWTRTGTDRHWLLIVADAVVFAVAVRSLARLAARTPVRPAPPPPVPAWARPAR
ncbi:hypothetical protein [Actinoplanes sp. L3-i22]|uniref:hypothetical protein n=1 Tax=Actinoplanes sp. L3-i22 TaxID=2836373 RepID=UPI001C783741|nr:hypothetical protein [Actinoplanes sp. L3-i22]BCY14948.1 hypothetical protein L3i22_100360 [Actinoplanes sp. L3-i22]